MNPFDFLNSINNKTEHLEDLTGYAHFLVTKGLSLFHDTIFYANEMNKYHWLDDRMQYDYFYYSVRKKKRFSVWPKAEHDEAIELIKQYFKYSTKKAKEVMPILTANQIMEIKEKLEKGGYKNGDKDRARTT